MKTSFDKRGSVLCRIPDTLVVNIFIMYVHVALLTVLQRYSKNNIEKVFQLPLFLTLSKSCGVSIDQTFR